MKTLPILIVAVAGLAIASCNPSLKPILSSDPVDSTSGGNRYRLHEVIVMYKGDPPAEKINALKVKLDAEGVELKSVKKCLGCDTKVELWEADNIHTQIHAEGLVAGTVSDRGKTVGEDDLAYYSVNFINSIPMDSTLRLDTINFNGKVTEFSSEGRDTITVAVLDTGMDLDGILSPRLQWKNDRETDNERDDDKNCYADDIHGWNFVDNNSDVDDDNINLHGTLVSHYIIDEFDVAKKNFVQIMSLKTHDANGEGDLFDAICALHYAMSKGVNIVNASWGFYYYTEKAHPYLDNLITTVMRKKGILFVTAAGNKVVESDEYAKEVYRERYRTEFPEDMLRDLEYHYFYPARLSKEGKNVITVTTTDDTRVSPTQNYSETYVDVGVMRDADDGNGMKFEMPIDGMTQLISGSSFATAIACGKIGAYFPKEGYTATLKKNHVFELLRETTPDGRPTIITSQAALAEQFVRKGKKTYSK